VVSPVGVAGTVDVRVTSRTGTSVKGAAARFTYVAPAPPPTPSGKPAIVARIVFARVMGHGKARVLQVRVRVSKPAAARLRLVSGKAVKLQKSFKVKGGGNLLQARVPMKVTRSVYRVQLRFTVSDGRSRTYAKTVRVPA